MGKALHGPSPHSSSELYFLAFALHHQMGQAKSGLIGTEVFQFAAQARFADVHTVDELHKPRLCSSQQMVQGPMQSMGQLVIISGLFYGRSVQVYAQVLDDLGFSGNEIIMGGQGPIVFAQRGQCLRCIRALAKVRSSVLASGGVDIWSKWRMAESK